MATSHVTDEELSAAKQRARVLIARQAARAPDDDDLTVVKKALVQELLQRERERVRERERGRAFADHLSRNDEWTVKDSLASAYAELAGGAQQHSRRALQPLPGTGELENVSRAPVVALKTRLQRGAEYVWEAYEEVQNWWEPVNNIAHALLQQPERDEGVATEEQLQWTVERFDGVHHTPPRRWRA